MDKEAVGPFQTAEVIRYLKENSNVLYSIQWITPEGHAPLLVMEWFSDFAGEGELETILARQAPTPSAEPAYWSSEKKDVASEAGSLQNNTSSGLTKNSSSESNKIIQRGWRQFLALFGLALIGTVVLVIGLKSLRSGKSYYRSANSLQAKLLSTTPDALRTYQLLLESRITRDPKKHASFLLKIQRYRALYPEGLLPTPEVTASLALLSFNHSELDTMREWRELLDLLPANARQRGLGVVAYELSRILQARTDVRVAQGSKKEKMSTQAIDEVAVALERLVRVTQGSKPTEVMLHGLLLGRALTLSLVTVLDDPYRAANNPMLVAALEKLPAIFPNLTSTDRDLVGIVRDLAQQSLREPKKTLSWSSALEKIVKLHTQNRFLCQLNDSGAGAETLLLLIQRAALTQQKLPQLSDDLEKCFIGLRVSPRLTLDSESAQGAARLEWVSLGKLDETLLRNFRLSFSTMSPALSRLSGKQSNAGDWLLILHFNGVLEARLSGSRTAAGTSAICGKKMSDTLLCLRARWAEMQGDWREFIPLLNEFQEIAMPGELSLIVERFVLDSAKRIIQRGGKNTGKEIGELFSNLKIYDVSNYPSLRFVLDYANSAEGDS